MNEPLLQPRPPVTSDGPLMAVEVNCETGVVTERLFTEEEITAHMARTEEWNLRQAEQEAADEALAALKASARAKLVAGTPLTAEEAATLVI